MKRGYFHIVGIFVLGMTVAGTAIMLTPLRFLSIIEPSIHEILPADFYKVYSESPDSYIFIDVRSVEEYNAEHAEGSISMPLETLYTQRRYLPKHGKTIVLICNGTQASGVGYGYLEHNGFLNLMRVTGGVPAWKAAGLPTILGGGVIPKQAQEDIKTKLSFISDRAACS
jgi:rhodanese-related sulfurtransferase